MQSCLSDLVCSCTLCLTVEMTPADWKESEKIGWFSYETQYKIQKELKLAWVDVLTDTRQNLRMKHHEIPKICSLYWFNEGARRESRLGFVNNHDDLHTVTFLFLSLLKLHYGHFSEKSGHFSRKKYSYFHTVHGESVPTVHVHQPSPATTHSFGLHGPPALV